MTTPHDTLTALAAPTGDLGAHFYFHPATVAAGRELGLGGFAFYILGRGGALGDVPAAVVSSAFGYFNPTTLGATWNKYREIVAPPVAAQAYWDECGKRGSEKLSDVDGLDAYVEAADIVIAQADVAALPLFAGTSQLTCSDDVAGHALQKAAVLRELRGSVHLVAVLASGLRDVQAHAIKRPDDVATFGWEEAPALPVDGGDMLDAAEALTNAMLERAFSTLTAAQSAALVDATTAMHEAITAES
ncbi:SCO6745 family protein [Ilumatobacter sp.]|uniref:SCO6745 family protein n=1 Tax=Ilumatobacter sp. TaxID=1967498 RepID=UPI003C59B26D